MGIPIEEAFTEEWVREALLLAMPEGVVDHRAPEVLASIHGARKTYQSISAAFWEPLSIFVRQYSREHDILKERLIERIEDVLVEDDRPYVGEWLAKQSIRWTWKDKAYWRDLLCRADRESKLPDHKAIGDYNIPSSRRRHGQTWWVAVRPYAEEWRLPDAVTSAYTGFKKPSDWVRQIRHIERCTASEPGSFPRIIKDNLDVRYGTETAKILGERIRLMTKDLDYVDNIRVAARDNKAEMSHYRWQRGQGCCGYQDIDIDVLGRPFTIGCNYGH